jgi:hypothetical protein
MKRRDRIECCCALRAESGFGWIIETAFLASALERRSAFLAGRWSRTALPCDPFTDAASPSSGFLELKLELAEIFISHNRAL